MLYTWKDRVKKLLNILSKLFLMVLFIIVPAFGGFKIKEFEHRKLQAKMINDFLERKGLYEDAAYFQNGAIPINKESQNNFSSIDGVTYYQDDNGNLVMVNANGETTIVAMGDEINSENTNITQPIEQSNGEKDDEVTIVPTEEPTIEQTPIQTEIPTIQPTSIPMPTPQVIENEIGVAEGDILTLADDFKITFYCPCKKCCGQYSYEVTGKLPTTASGTTPVAGRTIAVCKDQIPLGTTVIINGHEYVAEDTGGAIKWNRIDIYCDTHQEALNLGVQYAKVSIKR